MRHCWNHRWIATLVLAALLAGLHTPVVAAQSGAYHFDRGVQHYRQGAYQNALDAFRRAREAGMDSNRLRYNLALTHYKLRDYAASETLFQSLTETADFVAMAQYHLGLIEERRDRDTAAARRYQAAAERADASSSLYELAQAGLSRTRGLRETSIYAFAGGGIDDNPALLNEANLSNGDREGYLEFFGFVGHQRGAWLMEAGLYTRQYSETDEATTGLLTGAIGRQTQLAGGEFEYRAEAATVRVDRERLQEEYSTRFDWERRIGPSLYLDSRLRLTRIEAADNFDFLTGWRHRARLRTIGTIASGWWRLGYRFEWNDREDITNGDRFFSRSPLRHRIRLDAGHPLPGPFSLEGRLAYRHSRYREPDRFTNSDGSTTEQRRTEDRLVARLGTRWRLSQAWNVLLEYEYQDNSSSFDSFDYERNTVLLGVEWSQ